MEDVKRIAAEVAALADKRPVTAAQAWELWDWAIELQDATATVLQSLGELRKPPPPAPCAYIYRPDRAPERVQISVLKGGRADG